MKSPDALAAVAEFHRTFHVPVCTAPALPPPDRSRLRVNLLQEELDELQAAIADGDIVEVADALADLQYVLSGAVLEFGLGDRFKALFDEVHRSNMSKTCASRAEAEATVEHYRSLGQEGRVERSGDHWLVYRNSDNKVLKNLNYSPADLAGQLK
ncbi:nucleoside triphosphate pyrophosphohydrolase family protein [Lewinella sp. IMCC34183]|uniref:nucleoside triphosphate pyrophosphohydrolase family protein n=1 Tax=Lewinella sp. IMCC34183 TaxID=2248762 RepID=UPI000E27113E|nr:nucleoside triphosphate pyrophosphohydrolase family protein [Lewinella sp. IMCC34183]